MEQYRQDRNNWIIKCQQVLKSNLPDEAVLKNLSFRYTCPAKEKGTYLPQWLWDSCFHAIVYRWFDPKMAWEELQSLIVYQVREGDDTGMIPHMAYLAENNDVKDQELFQHPERSILTQPPLIALAAFEVHKLDPNPKILRRLFKAVREYHDWFDRRRDPEDEDLVAIIHPWESGWDVAPRWDVFMGFKGHEKGLLTILAKKRLELISLLIEFNCDVQKLIKVKNAFCVKPIDLNAIRAADIDALAEIARIIGKPETEFHFLKQKAARIREAIRQKMIEIKDDRVLAYDLAYGSLKSNLRGSAAKFLLLFGNCVSNQEAEFLVEELFEPDGCFHTPYMISSTATDDPAFNAGEYWRGNVWLPVNWLIFKGLYNYGFFQKMKDLAQNSIMLVGENGFYEFYNPLNGQRGKNLDVDCPQNQSWSTIILDMMMILQSNRV